MPPSMLNVQVMPEMDAVVRKALAKRPDERYQTAGEFADAISAAVAAADSMSTMNRSADATMMAPLDRTMLNPAVAMGAGVPVPPPPPVATAAAASPRNPAFIVVGVAALVAIAAAGWFWYQHQAGPATTGAQAPPAVATAPPAAPPAPPTPAAATTRSGAGSLTITAVGLVDPSDPRYQGDKSLMQADLRADTKSQLVEKAVGLLVDTGSIAKHYDLLKTRLLSKSGDYITTVVRESPPELGKDGLMSMTTEAVVNVKAVQKSLNQMTRDERVDFIRASGDPKISVAVSVRDADQPDAPAQPSPVAENILKERIKAFGFRTWSEGGAGPNDKGADFAVLGEAKIKKLSLQLQASGVTVTKYALTSWTVKCVDRETGEEIYYNTTLPQGIGSFATEEEALKAIGAKIADEFSREFFLQHANVTSQKVALDRRRNARRSRGRPARERARRIARRHRGDAAPVREASHLRSAARGKRRAGRYRREWRAEAAQCSARPGMLQSRRQRRRQGHRRARQALRRSIGAVATRIQSAGKPLRRAARSPEDGRPQSGNAEETRDLEVFKIDLGLAAGPQLA